MGGTVRFGILGPLEVLLDGQAVDAGAPKQWAVLALFLMHANRVVSLDRLISALWGDEPAASATGALQVYISNLRRVLEPQRRARARPEVLLTQPPGYLIRVERADLDATRFEDLASDGRRLLQAGDVTGAHAAITEALGLWRGPALAENAFEPFADHEAARLEELRATALEARLEADLALGAHGTVAAELESLVAEYPLREGLWALLMLALYRGGRQGDALRAYTRARTVLRDELGLEPGPELRRLDAQILAQSPALDLPPAPAPLVKAATAVTTTPAALALDRRATIVGRGDELAAIDVAVDQARRGAGNVIVVSGEPGIGKTTLVADATARAEASGATVVWGRSHEEEGAPPFWPWVQVIRGFLDIGDAVADALGPAAGDIAPVVPEVKELVPDLQPPPPLDPPSARFRFFEAVSGFLARQAAERPLVLVLDDLQWADAPTLALARHVAGRIGTMPILLVVIHRSVDPIPGTT